MNWMILPNRLSLFIPLFNPVVLPQAMSNDYATTTPTTPKTSNMLFFVQFVFDVNPNLNIIHKIYIPETHLLTQMTCVFHVVFTVRMK